MNEEFTKSILLLNMWKIDIFKVEHDELDFTAQAFLLDSQELGFAFLRSKWVKQL